MERQKVHVAITVNVEDTCAVGSDLVARESLWFDGLISSLAIVREVDVGTRTSEPQVDIAVVVDIAKGRADPVRGQLS